MTVTQFYSYLHAYEKRRKEQTALMWYLAQVAYEVDRLRYTVSAMFSKRPPYKKRIKDFLIPFVEEGKDGPPPAEEIVGGYTAPEERDPELERVRIARLSQLAKRSWGAFFGGAGKKKFKTQLPGAKPGDAPRPYRGKRAQKKPKGRNG